MDLSICILLIFGVYFYYCILMIRKEASRFNFHYYKSEQEFNEQKYLDSWIGRETHEN